MRWSSEQMFPTRIRGSLVPPRPSCPLSSPMTSVTLHIYHVGCCGLCGSALLPAFCHLHIRHDCYCNQFLHAGTLACRGGRDFPTFLMCVPYSLVLYCTRQADFYEASFFCCFYKWKCKRITKYSLSNTINNPSTCPLSTWNLIHSLSGVISSPALLTHQTEAGEYSLWVRYSRLSPLFAL